MNIITTRQAPYSEKHHTFACEVSSLGPAFHFGLLYDDACDVGVRLVSHKTGNEIPFVLDHIDEAEDEVHGWSLVPTKEALRQCPRLRGAQLLIFND